MSGNAGQRAFHNARNRKAQKAEVAQLFERAAMLQKAGLISDARAVLRQLLALAPRHFDALYLLGVTAFQAQNYQEAEAVLGEAVSLEPRSAKAHFNRSVALLELQRFEAAEKSCRRAIALDPRYTLALNTLGNICMLTNRLAEAVENYDRALALNQDFRDAWYNRGLVLTQQRKYLEAVASHDRALALSPGLAMAWVGRGDALRQAKQLAEALTSCARALSIDPRSYRAHALQGHCLAALGRTDEAIARFDDALAIKPDLADAISAKIFAVDFRDGVTFAEQRDVRKLWWERVGAPIAAASVPVHRNVRDPDRRLVVGYVSSDFGGHSASLTFKPVLQHADRTQIETVCYSCFNFEDVVAAQFRGMAARWRDASQWTDDRLADQIHQDGIDILVDLSGHTSGNRLGVFARKPAPIQVHGWGHGTPPGLPTIDYVFADAVTIPADVRGLFCETIHDLPCMLTLEELPAEVERAELPALANSFITFGAFNRISKISEQAAQAWAQILDRVPQSKLLIKDSALDDVQLRDSLLQRFARHGMTGERILVLGATSRVDHLRALNQVDIALDPFPQNGGVSTWEALRMGVPVVARLGNALSSRAAGGILSSIGMLDWVAESPEGYIEAAVRHASRIDELANLRRALPVRIAASVAGNPAAYTAEVGKAYRGMWRAWCARQADPPPN
jgi:predicted O-linked N-acetylglucosamine transferase (SPINDLY family)